MGGILSGVLSWFQGKPEVKVLILGLDAAGKTSILFQLKLGEFIQSARPTPAFNLEKVEVGNLKLEIWDLGGQKQLRPFWRLYYQNINGIVFVVDSADKQRIDICREELQALLQEEELRGVPVIIMANKQDLPEAMNVQELTSRLQLDTIKDRSWTIKETSAVKNVGITESFEWLSSTMEVKAK